MGAGVSISVAYMTNRLRMVDTHKLIRQDSPVMTELLSQEQAAELLAKHAAALNACVNRAWERWLANPDAATASKRTRAATVYDYITQEVERTFASVPGVRLRWKHNSLNMTVDDSAVLRFKKFRGKKLRTSGIATNARNNFLQQAGVLDGMVVTHLVVGYLLDELEQGTETIAVTCPMGKGNLWALDLGLEFGGEAGDVIPMPAPEDPDESGTVIRSTKVVASDDAAVNEE